MGKPIFKLKTKNVFKIIQKQNEKTPFVFSQ